MGNETWSLSLQSFRFRGGVQKQTGNYNRARYLAWRGRHRAVAAGSVKELVNKATRRKGRKGQDQVKLEELESSPYKRIPSNLRTGTKAMSLGRQMER